MFALCPVVSGIATEIDYGKNPHLGNFSCIFVGNLFQAARLAALRTVVSTEVTVHRVGF